MQDFQKEANPATISELLARLEAAASDALGQALLNGLGASREAALMAKLEAAERERAALRAEVESWKGLAAQFSKEADKAKTHLAFAKDELNHLRTEIKAIEQQEPVAWMSSRNGFICKDNKNTDYNMPLYLAPDAQHAQGVPECPYPCGWQNLLKRAIEDGAYLARHINEDEPVTENARFSAMLMVMRLRDVLIAVINAAPEAKP